ncbi:hypothetical protein POM88_047081 [Heracleum sosnowskyi]|uniref:Cyclopropane-fatty-acyl-phospholipid synthase n=1 Tax=Heracleum sosnowskyi TaxID=360622 RepID=A0AAD8HAI7_9APIA|nr:hypothetical protein POM88_047081 [Heracleum sosnowskyi]
MKVKEAGLQNNIKFLLCDYRQLQETNKFDRIISCEMIEHLGHEYMDEFFGFCESSLADDGIFVLQFISIPDERYDEHGNFIQAMCGTYRKHGDPLLADSQVLENKLFGKPKQNFCFGVRPKVPSYVGILF